MGDPETRMKFLLSDYTWLEKIEYGLVFKALWDLNEAKKNRGAFLFFLFFYFFIFLFLIIFSFFFFISFLLSFFFSFLFIIFYAPSNF
jgi:hypothetical protein